MIALCLDEKNCAFSQRVLKPWLKPIKIEVDFEQRAKLRRVEATNEPTSNGEPSPKKQRMLCYKPQPRVIFTGINKDEEKELIR